MSYKEQLDKYRRLYKSHRVRNPKLARGYLVRIDQLKKQMVILGTWGV